MINKGKGCISAIFDGSIPIGIIKHGLDTVFQKPSQPVVPPVEPVEGYIMDGIYANYSGYDCEGGTTWVDDVNGANITMYNSPTYDNETHSWTFTQSKKQYGKATLTAPPDDFTIEIYGSLPTKTTASWCVAMFGGIFGYYAGYGLRGYYSEYPKVAGFIATATNSNSQNLLDARTIFGTDIKTKWVLRRNKTTGKFDVYVKNINGELSKSETFTTASITPNPNNTFVIGTSKLTNGATTDFGSSTMYAVRVYNRALTDEEIAQNHAEDVRIYGE